MSSASLLLPSSPHLCKSNPLPPPRHPRSEVRAKHESKNNKHPNTSCGAGLPARELPHLEEERRGAARVGDGGGLEEGGGVLDHLPHVRR